MSINTFIVDESYRDMTGLIVVGGYYSPIEELEIIQNKLEVLKKDYHKNNIEHLSWSKIDIKMKSSVLGILNTEEIPKTRIIVSVLNDNRSNKNNKDNLLDFYCEALRYCIQKAGQISKEENKYTMVITDMLSFGNKPKKKYQKYKHVGRYTNKDFEEYHEWFYNSIQKGSRHKQPFNKLCELKFFPSLLVTQSSKSILLILADAIVGITRQFFEDISSSNISRKQKEDFFKNLIPFFYKSKSGEILNYGISLLPALKAKIEKPFKEYLDDHFIK